MVGVFTLPAGTRLTIAMNAFSPVGESDGRINGAGT